MAAYLVPRSPAASASCSEIRVRDYTEASQLLTCCIWFVQASVESL